MTPTATSIRAYLAEHGISVWAVAIAMRIDPAHLHRVLTGKRKGSPALFCAAAETAETLAPSHKRNSKEDHRLIDAAMHSFFLRRGYFESSICQGVLPANTGTAWERHYPPSMARNANQQPPESAKNPNHEKK
jgi:hypothetical protein